MTPETQAQYDALSPEAKVKWDRAEANSDFCKQLQDLIRAIDKLPVDMKASACDFCRKQLAEVAAIFTMQELVESLKSDGAAMAVAVLGPDGELKTL